MLSRSGNHYTCNCAAWKAAGGKQSSRTCRHLLVLLGGAYEEARLAWADAEGSGQHAGVADEEEDRDDGGNYVDSKQVTDNDEKKEEKGCAMRPKVWFDPDHDSPH